MNPHSLIGIESYSTSEKNLLRKSFKLPAKESAATKPAKKTSPKKKSPAKKAAVAAAAPAIAKPAEKKAASPKKAKKSPAKPKVAKKSPAKKAAKKPAKKKGFFPKVKIQLADLRLFPFVDLFSHFSIGLVIQYFITGKKDTRNEKKKILKKQ